MLATDPPTTVIGRHERRLTEGYLPAALQVIDFSPEFIRARGNSLARTHQNLEFGRLGAWRLQYRPAGRAPSKLSGDWLNCTYRPLWNVARERLRGRVISIFAPFLRPSRSTWICPPCVSTSCLAIVK